MERNRNEITEIQHNGLLTLNINHSSLLLGFCAMEKTAMEDARQPEPAELGRDQEKARKSDSVDEELGDKKCQSAEEQKKGKSGLCGLCCRCMVGLLCFPFVLVILLVGLVVWLVLLPGKWW